MLQKKFLNKILLFFYIIVACKRRNSRGDISTLTFTLMLSYVLKNIPFYFLNALQVSIHTVIFCVKLLFMCWKAYVFPEIDAPVAIIIVLLHKMTKTHLFYHYSGFSYWEKLVCRFRLEFIICVYRIVNLNNFNFWMASKSYMSCS